MQAAAKSDHFLSNHSMSPSTIIVIVAVEIPPPPLRIALCREFQSKPRMPNDFPHPKDIFGIIPLHITAGLSPAGQWLSHPHVRIMCGMF